MSFIERQGFPFSNEVIAGESNSGRVIGCLSPLIRYYRHFSDDLNRDREQKIALSVAEVRQRYPSLTVVLGGSHAFGLGYPCSDIDLGIATSDEEAEASGVFLTKLRGDLPRVSVNIKSELRPGDLTMVETFIDAVKPNPNIANFKRQFPYGINGLRDVFSEMVWGGVIFGYPFDKTVGAARCLTTESIIAAVLFRRESEWQRLIIGHYRKILLAEYHFRLTDSARFKKGDKRKLLGQLGGLEQRLGENFV